MLIIIAKKRDKVHFKDLSQFGTAYQSGYSFVRLTPIIEHESKGCVSLSYWNQGQIPG